MTIDDAKDSGYIVIQSGEALNALFSAVNCWFGITEGDTDPLGAKLSLEQARAHHEQYRPLLQAIALQLVKLGDEIIAKPAGLPPTELQDLVDMAVREAAQTGGPQSAKALNQLIERMVTKNQQGDDPDDQGWTKYRDN